MPQRYAGQPALSFDFMTVNLSERTVAPPPAWLTECPRQLRFFGQPMWLALEKALGLVILRQRFAH
jgi:hypothetical protein